MKYQFNIPNLFNVIVILVFLAADDDFPYFITFVIEGDLITMGEITVGKELISWLYNISVANSNVKEHNIPLQWRSKFSKDCHVLAADINMCNGTIWKSLQ